MNGNTAAPTDDPGWYNVPDNFSGVYLGNQWMLSARHAVSFSPSSPLDGLPTAVISGVEYKPIENTAIVLDNPSGQGLSAASDLIMWRVDTGNQLDGKPEVLEPRIKPISLIDSQVSLGSEVFMIGRGADRLDGNLSRWNVNDSVDPWVWTSTNIRGDHTGYRTALSRTKRWGTNRVASDELVPNENDGDNRVITGVGGGITMQTLVTEFNEVGGTEFEAQGAGGDSGGPVFFKQGNEWHLAGVMHAIFTFPGQSAGWAVFGNLTAFTDFSVPEYGDQINALLADNNYSIVGDINLDGVVTGDGTGAWESDDVTAFIQGWQHSQPEADILSWKRGDLDQNGVTDLQDFVLLRGALGPSGGFGQLAATLGIGTHTIPEPGSWLLLMLAGWGFLFRRLGRIRRARSAC